MIQTPPIDGTILSNYPVGDVSCLKYRQVYFTKDGEVCRQTVDHIREGLENYFGFSFTNAKSKSEEVVHARQIMCHLLNIHTGLKLKSIGIEAGYSDHASVLHSLSMVKSRSKLYEGYKRQVIEIEDYIEEVLNERGL